MRKRYSIPTSAIAQPQKSPRVRDAGRSRWLTALLLSSTWLAAVPVLAASPTAGTVIDNQATGSFIDSTDNTEKAISSNTVSVTVAEVAGITITPANTPSAAPGGTANFDFTIANVGNDPTQFFIPGAPSAITGGTAGTLQIVSYDPDGSGPLAAVDLTASNITVPAGGGATGALLGAIATANNGVIPVGAAIGVRVPVTVTATNGNPVAVTLGNTSGQPSASNTPYVLGANGTGSQDLYTVDNADGVAGEAAGLPLNGDATNRRQEASATTTVTAISVNVTVSGVVFSDADANVTINGSDAGTNAGSASLTIYAVNSTGNVVDKAIVAANGTYSLTNVPVSSSVTLRLSNDASVAIGATAPTNATIPSGWYFTGENINGTVDGAIATLGNIALTTATSNVINQNFGIRQGYVIAPDPAPNTCNPDYTGALTTGISASGGQLTVGSNDLNWTAEWISGLTTGVNAPFATPRPVGPMPAVVVGNQAPGAWVNELSNARWISYPFRLSSNADALHQDANLNGSNNNQLTGTPTDAVRVKFTALVTLPSNANTLSISLPIGVSVDNQFVSVKVNGVENLVPPPTFDSQAESYRSFSTVNLQNGWQPGVNTIEIVVDSGPPLLGFFVKVNATTTQVCGSTLSGSVFNDVNGSKLQNSPETGTNGGGLNAVLVNGSNTVVATAPVAADGTYSFPDILPGTYTVQITTATATVGSPAPAIALPNNWVSTGENLNGTADGTVDSQQTITVGTTAVTGINFGIEQLPTAVGGTATSQTNPGGTSTVAVASTLFTGSTDPDGTVASYKITAFPSNATSITINGTQYTSASFPGGGVTVTTAQLAGMLVDPINGAVTVGISFQAIDNAGQTSSNTATASLPFSAITQTIDATPSATSCVVQGGTLIGANLFTPLDNGTMGFESGAPNQSPATNPYPGVVSGGTYAQYGSGTGSFLNPTYGEYSYVANMQTPRNSFQHKGITDPVYGVTGRYFVSDPNTSTPTLSITLTGLTPNKFYEYSFWAANAEPTGNPNNIDIIIDGKTVYNTGPLPAVSAALAWKKHTFTFTNGPNTSISIDLKSTQVGAGGNDFNLDNIELKSCDFGIDHGDAPASYGDALHTTIPTSPTIYLGTISPDSETVAPSGGMADGDDSTGTNDEDAFTTLPDIPTTGTYNLTNIPVHNTSGSNATLHAWIDFNGNGQFEASEYQSTTVSNGTTTANLNWTVPGGITPGGSTYARFRITQNQLIADDLSTTVDERSKDAVIQGEVEDYRVAILGLPNVLLVKRITAINGGTAGRTLTSAPIDLTQLVNDPNTTDDNNANWPGSYLTGAIDGGVVKPNDELEYTIYFLSSGTSTAKNVLLCDRIPDNTTFLPTGFNAGSFVADPAGLPGADRGIVLSLGLSGNSLSNVGDSDRAQFFPAGVEPSSVFPNINCGGPNTTGAVVVNIGDVVNATAPGTPTTSYGFLRFRATVK